jgi:hypothetical protein
MTNRRQFLHTGVSMSALPLAGGLLSPDVHARNELSYVPLQRAIFDDRYAESRNFGDAMERFGVPLHGLRNGDVTELRHGAPGLFRRKPPAGIAGTTQFGPMLVFEQFGRGHRMRVALRVEHRARDDGTIAHVMTGPPATLALAERLRVQGVAWPELMAVLVTHYRADGSTLVERTMVMPGPRPALRQTGTPHRAPESVIHYYTPLAIREGHGIPWDGPLFSWVIVPAAERAG